jgi:hypothetical protein
VDSLHGAVNQDGVAVFVVGKRTMFPPVSDLPCKPLQGAPPVDHVGRKLRATSGKTPLVDKLLASGTQLANAAALQHALSVLPGTVIVHNMVKVFGSSEVRSLCNLMKITNSYHFVRRPAVLKLEWIS